MITRNTKQKELILDILEHHRTHPTIQEIYEFAKEKDATIGQATIYRNVKRLADEGHILKLPNSTNDSFHYDINTTPHIHLLCKKCNKIVDIFDNDYESIIKALENKYSISIEKTNIMLEGLCSNCSKKHV